MKRQTGIRLLFAGVILTVMALGAARAEDWPQWRGPGRDGHVTSPVPQAWPPTLKPQWKVEVGLGHASPVVVGQTVYQFSRQGDEEVVRALRLDDGKEVWSHRYPAPFQMSPYAASHGKGPKSTPVVADGRLVTLGIGGILSGWDASTGKLLWRHDFAKQYPGQSPIFYGAAMSPMIDQGRVIAHVGGHDHGALVALDAQTGQLQWQWNGDGPGYASPIVVSRNGTRQIVTQSQKACIGVSAADGKLLWSIPFDTAYDQNIVTPVEAGDLIIFSGVDKGITAYRLAGQGDRWTPQQAWHTDEVSFYMSSPVAVGDRLVGLSHRKKGSFCCLDARSGKVHWTGDGRVGDYAVLLAAGDTILAQTVPGQLIVFRATADRYLPITTYTLSDKPTWAQPAILSDGLLVKDVESLARLKW